MTDLLTELPIVDESKFRLQSQRLMLTYKTHLNKENLRTFFLIHIPRAVYIAHENGTGDTVTPYEHTHVVIDFGKIYNSRDSRCFDFEGIHPNISKIINKMNWKKSCKYICKEDKTVTLLPDDQFEDGFDVNSVWKHQNLQDALSNMTSIRDALPTIAIFNAKNTDWGREIKCPIRTVDDMYIWQKQIWDTIMTSPDYREIVWIQDEDGCKGKTQLIKYCAINEPGKVMWIEPSGTTRDIINIIFQKIKNGWRGDTVMINLPRSATACGDMAHVYRVIENLKDGMIFSTKYMGGDILIPSLHIIVMSNVEPERHRLTADRWCVYKIKNLELAPVTLSKRALGNMTL